MNYEISISVEEGSDADRNIKSVSLSQHLSNEEAALQLISSHSESEERPADLIARVRANKARRKTGTWPLSEPDGNAEKLIGLLADEPEIADAIRNQASERRKQAYGS